VGTHFDFRSDDETCTTPDTGIQGNQLGARQRAEAAAAETGTPWYGPGMPFACAISARLMSMRWSLMHNF
jgi:hypothetical protein